MKKKTNKVKSEQQPAPEQPAPEQPAFEVVAKPVMLKVKITAARAKVGNCICAKGAVISITKEQADALVSAELAEIIGI